MTYLAFRQGTSFHFLLSLCVPQASKDSDARGTQSEREGGNEKETDDASLKLLAALSNGESSKYNKK